MSSDVTLETMQIIAFAGDARSDFLEAVRCAGKGDKEKAEQLIEEGKNKILEAHHFQTDLIQRECGGERLDINFLSIHGQDHLMTALVIKDLSQCILDLYQRIEILEEKKND